MKKYLGISSIITARVCFHYEKALKHAFVKSEFC